MDLAGTVENFLRLTLLIAGLLLPGSMLLRALRLPWSLAAAFAASAVTLYVTVLAFAGTGLTISLPTLTAALAGVTISARLIPAGRNAGELNSSFACLTRQGWWLPLYAAFWLIVGYRLVAQPLTGPDVHFRWSWLAEQMLRFGSLDFYPARSGADFVRYFWAESVPPGVASLYGWAYACGGTTNPLWTSPVVALQLFSLHEIIWRLGSRWGGERVARRAVLLAAACPLLTWAGLIGQETGLTALGVVGLAWCLHHLRETDGDRWAVLAGIFAVLAAGTREYGVTFVATGLALVALAGGSRRRTLLFALVGLPLAAAWPLRVWLLTANPFYSLDLGGLLPVNTLFVEWTAAFHTPHSDPLAAADAWSGLARYFLLWALPAVLGLGALLVLLARRLGEARPLAVLVALTLLLWSLSLAHTAGGVFYSLRVLSPAFALLVVMAAYALGAFLHSTAATRLVSLLVFLLLAESLPKTLVLPDNPYSTSLAHWPLAGRQFNDVVDAEHQVLRTKLKGLPPQKLILSDDASMPHVFAGMGTDVAPLWSPAVAWLFDSSLKPEIVAEKWQASGLRYLIVGKTGPTAGFLATHARWRAPYFTLRRAAETDTHVILEATVVP